MLKIEPNRKAGFTLMETLITVVILGILAAILVPNLIKNQVENANRTKVKKAMASYEKAINYMIIENDIRETEALRELGQDNCQYTREYFKTVKDGSNNCIFKTADRVWWDITDITNPILILKDSQLEKSETELKTLAKNVNDNTVFALVGRFDDLGTLRINDNAYEHGLKNNIVNQKYMKKLWFMITQSDSILSEFDKCSLNNKTICTISVNGVSTTYTKITSNQDIAINKTYKGQSLCIYSDRETFELECGYTSTAAAGDYWVYSIGRPSTNQAKSEQTCSTSTISNCSETGDYYEFAKQKCEKSGGHLANLAELEIARNNGKLIGWVFSSEETILSSKPGYAYSLYSSDGKVAANSKANQAGVYLCVGIDN